MTAVLPESFGRRHDIPLRCTYPADLAIAYVMQAIRLTTDGQGRMQEHILASHARVQRMRKNRSVI